ncbi:MAG: hypothetical protein UU64_C0002G0106 [candidate division WWE3 bacterium GW2011_GWF2_41_45]|nr:MAG: hypothetical protein UU55_C0001G0012 [candidate division WWE3 bacterium GW2011_GWC2_41_23]KKS10704.1 MAG: hypothetical protein UU64_C0002G0106 [candidate division WWE3 bacterium GW2011_GWF2_41_45]KKS12285.1 MAG: hypothetical protein UU68_C0002G0011 [candidate division WWE3 bacterium GW2011_GWF1_41_53]KKS20358.1 MAG: hypothetical protein UU79_C0001G0012 [candidate division WWE3 bacterium GW2011_GWE1_41_72]KKS28184.1 MAG: hypothetical protein UU86_C0009G0014 [candidate division WWE3 bacte
MSNPRWIKNEFKEEILTGKRSSQLRNVLVHAFIVEGIVRKHTGRDTFSSAILTLLLKEEISKSEATLLNELSSNRNDLVHNITDEKKFPDQTSIGNKQKILMQNIRDIYMKSKFLDKNLIQKYGLSIRSYIPYKPFSEKG